MNQAEIKSPEIQHNSGLRLTNLREKAKVSLLKRAIFILSSCVLLLHLNPRPARIEMDLLRLSVLETLDHQRVS